MLLQSATSQPPFHHHNFSSSISSSSSSRPQSLSFQYPSGFSNSYLQSLARFPNSTFLQKTICSVSEGNNYITVDYENKPYVKWKDLFQRVIKVENDFEKECVHVLNQWENDGDLLKQWEVNKIVKEFRKRKRYKHALAVFEWMNSRADRFILSASDTSIHLDLIAKVRGISEAEDFFFNLPDTLKNERVYGALLNAYAKLNDREKAESFLAQMKEIGYLNRTISYNVMMTLYMNLKDYEKVESVVSEMMENNIPLDLYTYNIWISSLGAQGSAEKMEQVIEEMNQDPTIEPNWSALTTRATMYIKLGQLDKAEECLKLVESRLTRGNRMPYHYIISLYGQIGKKEEVKRIWNIYKTLFPFVPNLSFYTVISTLTKLGDIEEAENLYEEWLSVKQNFDTRICNRLLLMYFKNGYPEKTVDLFYKIREEGGKPLASSWEILAAARIAQGKVSDAVYCLEKAYTASGSENWKPRPFNVCDILELCEREGDNTSKEILIGLMKKVGCFEDEGYMSHIPSLNAGKNSTIADRRINEFDKDDDDDGVEQFLREIESS